MDMTCDTLSKGCDDSIQRLTNDHDLNDFPAWSPDGKRIAYQSWQNGSFEIYVTDIACSSPSQTCTKQPQRLTSNEANDNAPTWSPDGRYITFSSDRDGKPKIYIMEADGGNQRLLVSTAGSDLVPKWS